MWNVSSWMLYVSDQLIFLSIKSISSQPIISEINSEYVNPRFKKLSVIINKKINTPKKNCIEIL